MKRRRLSIDFIVMLVFLAVGVFSLVITQCFAQPDPGAPVYVPEPGSLALIATTGFFGYAVRFARRRFQNFKRWFDILAGITGLILAAPLITVTAGIIKLVSPGPVFFQQERVGKGGRIFKLYKLRTMRVDAEKESGPVWAQENDSRYIMFGKLIRKAHLDELPQLWNVLRGEMSIIGPRPERPFFVRQLSKEIKDYNKRLQVKPGITGLAQVRQKYDETIEDVRRKVKFDLLYARRMCLWVDMRILALTVYVALTGKGAR